MHWGLTAAPLPLHQVELAVPIKLLTGCKSSIDFLLQQINEQSDDSSVVSQPPPESLCTSYFDEIIIIDVIKIAARQHVVFPPLSKGRGSTAPAAPAAPARAAPATATFYHLFSSTPPQPPPPFLPLPPSYRVMELPTQKQDTVYKWDAEGEKLFLPTESYGLGIAKLQSWQSTGPRSPVRVITPNKEEQGRGEIVQVKRGGRRGGGGGGGGSVSIRCFKSPSI